MFGRRHFRFPSLPDAYPFILTDEKEKNELAEFDAVIAEAQRKKIARLRELARQKGIAAPRLEDLKSECGEPFLEKSDRFRREYQVAEARKQTSDLEQSFAEPETAYLCAFYLFPEQNTENSCGWVKGHPAEESYDEIGPLCGSAGVRYYCKICRTLVGELRAVVS